LNQPSNRTRTLSDQLRLWVLLVTAFAAGAETALRWRDGRWPFANGLPDLRSWTFPSRHSSGQTIFTRDDAGQAVRLDRPASPGPQLPKPDGKASKEIPERLGDETGSSAASARKEIFDRVLPEP